jgi:hypothetical protein
MRDLVAMLVVAAAICTMPKNVVAQPEASAPPTQYPDPQCHRPNVKLIKPEYSQVGNTVSSGAVGSYNALVKTYNREANAYNACMHSYIDNANSELKRIQNDANEKIKQITDGANTRLKSVEGKIAQAVSDANGVAEEEAAAHQ